MVDDTLAFLADPYGFVSKRCDRAGTDLFETRLMLRRIVCLRGEEAARLFYDPQRFRRRGAAPRRLTQTLFGEGGVQSLDGAPHRTRKAMLLSILTGERVAELVARVEAEWRAAASRWAAYDRVVLYDALHEILTRAVCAWAGVPLEAHEVARRTRELVALFDGAGAVGPRHWASRRSRDRADRWAADIIEQVRADRVQAPAHTAAYVIAHHVDDDGKRLPPRIAGVELLNVLRPTVAVSVYLTFIAHALHAHPQHAEALARGGPFVERFVQEVRRVYPFFPAVVAIARQDFEWRGTRFRKGRWTLFDLYGTNHDPRLWDEPEAFRPERFARWNGSAFNFVPQGGGSHATGHRCPGEWITIELMKMGARFLAGSLAYDVPPQDLELDRTRLPALPRSRFVLRDVRLRPERMPAAERFEGRPP